MGILALPKYISRATVITNNTVMIHTGGIDYTGNIFHFSKKALHAYEKLICVVWFHAFCAKTDDISLVESPVLRLYELYLFVYTVITAMMTPKRVSPRNFQYLRKTNSRIHRLPAFISFPFCNAP